MDSSSRDRSGSNNKHWNNDDDDGDDHNRSSEMNVEQQDEISVKNLHLPWLLSPASKFCLASLRCFSCPFPGNYSSSTMSIYLLAVYTIYICAFSRLASLPALYYRLNWVQLSWEPRWMASTRACPTLMKLLLWQAYLMMWIIVVILVATATTATADIRTVDNEIDGIGNADWFEQTRATPTNQPASQPASL